MQAVKLLVVGITLIALVAVFSTNAVASRIVTNQSDVFNGLTFDASLTQDDEAYLRENLL
jgi:hypothetical protein